MDAARIGQRNSMRLTMLAAVLTAGTLSACVGSPGGSPSSMPASTHLPSVVASQDGSAPLETLSGKHLSPIYWLGERDSTVYLYREYVSAEDQGDPVTTAIKYLTEHEPEDPDYFNLWSKASRIGTSIDANNVITVDISADALGRKVDAGLAERAIQQLVYTATAAAAASGLISESPASRVDILVDGHSGFEAFGHVKLTGPIQRDATLRAPIWIIDPQEGAAIGSGSLRAHGIAEDFPGGSRWVLQQMRDGKASRISGGRLDLGAGSLAANEYELSFNDLGPGTYQLRVWGIDKDGSTRLSEDSRTFTVK